jgi:hypothetical protein
MFNKPTSVLQNKSSLLGMTKFTFVRYDIWSQFVVLLKLGFHVQKTEVGPKCDQNTIMTIVNLVSLYLSQT